MLSAPWGASFTELTSTSRVLAAAARSTPKLAVPPSSRTLKLKVALFVPAEDGIRVLYVTGVQTCALPISSPAATAAPSSLSELPAGRLREVTLTEARWLAGESLGSENPKSPGAKV